MQRKPDGVPARASLQGEPSTFRPLRHRYGACVTIILEQHMVGRAMIFTGRDCLRLLGGSSRAFPICVARDTNMRYRNTTPNFCCSECAGCVSVSIRSLWRPGGGWFRWLPLPDGM